MLQLTFHCFLVDVDWKTGSDFEKDSFVLAEGGTIGAH